MSEAIQTIVLQGGNAIQIAEVAKAAGVRDLRQSALLKVKNGLTTLAEINRITVD
jgi:type IV pilus assembly protein PilB